MINIRNVTSQFNYDPDYIHLANGVVASHPACVRLAIKKYHHKLDKNPALTVMKREKLNQNTLKVASIYLNTSPELIALTESTTMGLSLLYHGLNLPADAEVISSIHDHYITQETLRIKCQREKLIFRQIKLYDNSFLTKPNDIVHHIIGQITAKTRMLALTWVHSCTGIKLPIAAIGKALQKINVKRSDDEKILLCIDGVHALGIENFEIDALHCDFFIAGCHKSLYGPRGTGIVWGNKIAWSRVSPIMPSFDDAVFLPWLKNISPETVAPSARLCSPGGFTAFEHRWALAEAFNFHLKIGKQKIAEHIQVLNSFYKKEMVKIKNVKLYTPIDPQLSSGLICFEINGLSPTQIVNALRKEKIIAGQTPYITSYTRLMPGLCNTFDEMWAVLEVIKKLAKT